MDAIKFMYDHWFLTSWFIILIACLIEGCRK